MVLVDCERRELPGGERGQGADQQRRESARRQFLFVDNLRFLSMLGILAVHCAGPVAGALQLGSPALLRWLEDALKFGTIAFFLISGFLLGDRFTTTEPVAYLRRRLKKVFVPWLFWFYVQVAYFVAAGMYQHRLRLTWSWKTIQVVGGMVNACAMSSAFWFVPNLFLAVMVLLAVRRYLFSIQLGAVLLAVNLFYVLNIYTEWMPSGHTLALFGFVFYVWLGSYAARHYERILGAIARIPMGALVAGLAISVALSMAETELLVRMHSFDPLNTLRLSNQVFSVLMVLLLSRVRVATWPRFVDVRRQMFGVYLTQTLVLGLLGSGMKRLLPLLPGAESLRGGAGLVAVWLVVTATVFLICIQISRGLAKHRKLGWMVGDLSLHRAERRAALLIQQRAADLRGLERVVVSGRAAGEEPGQEMGEPRLA